MGPRGRHLLAAEGSRFQASPGSARGDNFERWSLFGALSAKFCKLDILRLLERFFFSLDYVVHFVEMNQIRRVRSKSVLQFLKFPQITTIY